MRTFITNGIKALDLQYLIRVKERELGLNLATDCTDIDSSRPGEYIGFSEVDEVLVALAKASFEVTGKPNILVALMTMALDPESFSDEARMLATFRVLALFEGVKEIE